jgi:glycogen debranching enzyme
MTIVITFGPQVCGDLAASATREWLVTDGRGGYAMGTVAGLRTRRYHALLVVAGTPPAARRVGLVSLDPVLTLPSGATIRLGTHEWASGAIVPDGHRYLERFDLIGGLPRWRWRVGEVVLERELAMSRDRPGVAVVHRLVAGPPVTLTLEALCTWRDAHGERGAGGPPPRVEPVADGAVVESAYRLSGPGFVPAGKWWHGVYHREEAARGLAPAEDLWLAGRFQAELAPGDPLEVCAWAGDLAIPAPAASRIVAAARARFRGIDPATDAFVITTPDGPDVVAGYPWFGAWSRDTMIAYEGLFLTTGRVDEGRDLLRGYAARLSQGMLPNTADTGALGYNTVDATLWFLHAAERHVAATGDTDLAVELLPALYGVVTAHVAGTRYGIRVDDDGLLTQGAAGEALTWMDARVDGVPVTPRTGKPVEVNALWANGLAAVAALREKVGQDATDLHRWRAAATDAFRRRYPNRRGWLSDVVDGPAGDDPTLRPNQLLAYALPYPAVSPDPELLRRIGAALLTPLGLRSLAPQDPGYQPVHRGGPAGRDGAYHQGTVWPWLIGPYQVACRRAGLPTDDLLAGLEAHTGEWGLGSVSETADATAPHTATGCPFQAWSVAELVRARAI